MIEALVYIAGAMVTAAVAAVRAGKASMKNSDQLFEAVRVVRKHGSPFFDFTYHMGKIEEHLRRENLIPPKTQKALLASIPVVLFWPVAVPLLILFGYGKWRGRIDAQATKLKAAVDAEVERIRREEGWV